MGKKVLMTVQSLGPYVARGGAEEKRLRALEQEQIKEGEWIADLSVIDWRGTERESETFNGHTSSATWRQLITPNCAKKHFTWLLHWFLLRQILEKTVASTSVDFSHPSYTPVDCKLKIISISREATDDILNSLQFRLLPDDLEVYYENPPLNPKS